MSSRTDPVEWRGFTIPGNKNSEWDDEIHGIEVEGDDESGDCAVISWRPGEYSFSSGCAQSFDFRVPESANATGPSEVVLKGIHEFLKVAYDE